MGAGGGHHSASAKPPVELGQLLLARDPPHRFLAATDASTGLTIFDTSGVVSRPTAPCYARSTGHSHSDPDLLLEICQAVQDVQVAKLVSKMVESVKR